MPTSPRVDLDRVGDVLREAAERAITPRFRSLSPREVGAEGADGVVTVADLESEQLISSALAGLAPGIPVVGEEACHRSPGLVDSVLGLRTYWLLDPLDGTAGFVAGDPDFGVMLALVHEGDVVASWIWQPVHEVLLVAERGAGTYRNGERIREPGPSGERPEGELAGWAWTRFLPPDARAGVEANRHRFARLGTGPGAAAVAYDRLLLGESDFSLYGRTEPWDHAAGALLLREAGGAARRPDGSEYRPGGPGSGLLVTRSAGDWTTVHDALLG